MGLENRAAPARLVALATTMPAPSCAAAETLTPKFREEKAYMHR